MKPTKARTKAARKPTQGRAHATVDAILEAAARILEREGMGRLGTNRIAREAGVSIGSLYEYFAGRDAIVRALCERHLAGLKDLVDTAFAHLADAPLDLAVDVFIDALFALHASRPALHRTLQHEFPLHFGLEPFIESDRYFEQKLVEWLRRRRPDRPLDDLTTRAFIAIRASRVVTIHTFAEGLDEERRGRVRAGLKELLLLTLRDPTGEPRGG
jgi:AcrR family transcriptional regulator